MGLTSLSPTIVPADTIIEKCIGLIAASHRAGYGTHLPTDGGIGVYAPKECNLLEVDEDDTACFNSAMKWRLQLARGHILLKRVDPDRSMVLFVDTETKSVHIMIEDAKGLENARLHDQCRLLISEVIPNSAEEEWTLTYSYSAAASDRMDS
eukprot:2794445-Rhodomonas_salina.1